jgi:hypothetical protein
LTWVGVAGFEPAASSSRSQHAAWHASIAAWLACIAASANVPVCPPWCWGIVTQLVTRRLQRKSASKPMTHRAYEDNECHSRNGQKYQDHRTDTHEDPGRAGLRLPPSWWHPGRGHGGQYAPRTAESRGWLRSLDIMSSLYDHLKHSPSPPPYPIASQTRRRTGSVKLLFT